MATTLDEVMRLAMQVKIRGGELEYDYGPFDAYAKAVEALQDALEPIIADAQRYRSLQGKIDGNTEFKWTDYLKTEADWRLSVDWCISLAVKEAVEKEREECARVCDEQAKEPECPERAAYCAEAIRARKDR